MVLTYVLFVLAIANCLASNNDWSSRTLEAYFNRLGGRIDTLVGRLEHLDNRITRFSSLVQNRLDSIENGLTTSKLKMDLWGEELNRIEEQLTRKWKNMESKIESFVPSMEAKLESKLNLIQRDNRRHAEHLSGLFTGLGLRVDKSNERVANFTNNERAICPTKVQPVVSNAMLLKSEEKLIAMMEDFGNKSSEVLKSGSTFVLMSSKVNNLVTNMFEDLIRRSDNIQTGVKDSVNMVNNTRRELQDSFRVLAQTKRTPTSFNGGSMTSSETMSAVVVEALASVESMSTALGRRMAELSRSIEERFEMVSMTLNGFLESCIRIQDGAPLIEEHIASVLEKILDAFDNNSRTSTEEFYHIRGKLDFLLNGSIVCGSGGSMNSSYGEYFDQFTDELPNQSSRYNITPGMGGATSNHNTHNRVPVNPHDIRTAEILKNSEDLTEDEKKTLWESLFPNHNVPD